MMPHTTTSTAGKTVAMYFGQPVANLNLQVREFLPDEAIPPIKMGDGEAPVAQELKYLGSMLSKNLIGASRPPFNLPVTSRGSRTVWVVSSLKLLPQKKARTLTTV
jgi:hypothetical protein